MLKQILALAAVVIVVITGVLAYSIFRTPQAASGPLAAIPVTVEQSTVDPVAGEAQTGTGATEVEENANPDSTEAAAAQTPPDDEATANLPQTPAADTQAVTQPAAPVIFEISQGESQARFVINEVLRSQPTTVVGVTDQVAGQIAVDPTNTSAVQIGAIQVNVRSLATDNNMRNRAIKNAILQTDTYELVTFVPVEVVGLPANAALGASYSLQISGDLTIKNVTRQVTFDATVTPVAESRLEGTATATILYRDFDLFIPDSPSVDTVADEVRLELDFVAEAVA